MPTLLVSTQPCYCGECLHRAELVLGGGRVALRDPSQWVIRAVQRDGSIEVRAWYRGCLVRALSR